MKKKSITTHLTNYSIYNKRKTTINHAFASALSVPDVYDESRLDAALRLLGQDPNADLLCVYCDKNAETWDHIYAVVKDGNFSGYGHQIGNLVPCCKNCNSQKRNIDWEIFLMKIHPEEKKQPIRIARIRNYISKYNSPVTDSNDSQLEQLLEDYDKIKEQVFELFKKADVQAEQIRAISKKKNMLY